MLPTMLYEYGWKGHSGQLVKISFPRQCITNVLNCLDPIAGNPT
jgi:hypothetical protein